MICFTSQLTFGILCLCLEFQGWIYRWTLQMLGKCPLCSPGWLRAHSPHEYTPYRRGLQAYATIPPYYRTASVTLPCILAVGDLVSLSSTGICCCLPRLSWLRSLRLHRMKQLSNCVFCKARLPLILQPQ